MYSENAVDVFDVNNMEWIQTMPLKKVSAGGLAALWRLLLEQLLITASNSNDVSDEMIIIICVPPLRCGL